MRRHRLVIDPAKPEQCEKSTPPTHEIIREIHRQIICDTVLGEERARIAAASVVASVAPSAAKRAKVPQAGEGKTRPPPGPAVVRQAPSPPRPTVRCRIVHTEGRGNVTAERDGKSRRTGQPDLLASLPDERPPASQRPRYRFGRDRGIADRGAGPPRAICRTEGSGVRRPACASACGTDAGGA